MNFISAFDVIGPNMVGPSSSHTAGAAAIGRLALSLCKKEFDSVRFTLYGSFAKTYKGHGTDKALLGGVLGFAVDDLRIREAFAEADKAGVAYEFVVDDATITDHPNTADLEFFSQGEKFLTVRGISVGGGRIKIVRINGVDVDFTGEYSTLLISQFDRPGVIMNIAKCLSDHNVNIAFMKLFRLAKGATAYTVVESDEPIPEEVRQQIQNVPNVKTVLILQ